MSKSYKNGTKIQVHLSPSDLATVWRAIDMYGKTFNETMNLEQLAYQAIAMYVRVMIQEVQRAQTTTTEEQASDTGAEDTAGVSEESPEAADTGALADEDQGDSQTTGTEG